MSFDYINEAFKSLDLLEERMFDTSLNGINELSDFMDNDNTNDVIRIIDPNADSDEDVQDSYVGKVIVKCNVCHSHVFEDKDELTIDDEGVVNADVSCPYCGEDGGFTIVGEIAPFSETPVETPDVTLSDDSDMVANESLNMSRASKVASMLETYKPAKNERVVDSNAKETLVHNGNIYQVFNNNGVHVGSIEADDDNKAKSKWGLRRFEESLNEDFKEVSITTDDQHMQMTSDDNGKVTVVTEPVSSQEETLNTLETETSSVDGEVISPVSDETQQDILDNNNVTGEGATTEENTPDATTEENSSEENENDNNPEENETEVDIEEVDEEGMDELGESYLRRVYENVKSFKTTSVAANSRNLVVEGVITFKSGAQKKTGFVFESCEMNSRNQLRFRGSNKHLAESKNAFSLVGCVDNKRLFVESLKYNYKVNDTCVRGLVKRK